MNAAVAELLKLRLQGFSYVEKLAGLVRAVTYERAGRTFTIPVGTNVEDPLQCGDAELLDLVPDQRYKTIVYFEDRGLLPTQSRTRGRSYTSSLRLVCWLNTAKLGGDVNAGDTVMQKFLLALHHGPYNMGPFIGVKHRIAGIPTKGPTLFSPYTYPDGVRQYLLFPFDAFGIDITTEFRIKPGCEDEVSGNSVECWTPPATERKKHPREFTCDELNDPINGLTDAQKADCLDCEGTTCAGVDILDGDGNVIAHVNDGDTYTVTEMAYIAGTYANTAAALADNVTIVAAGQAILVAGRLYQGTGTTAAALVTVGVFNPSFTEPGNLSLLTVVDGIVASVQLNA